MFLWLTLSGGVAQVVLQRMLFVVDFLQIKGVDGVRWKILDEVKLLFAIKFFGLLDPIWREKWSSVCHFFKNIFCSIPKVHSYYFTLDSTLTKVNVAQVRIVSCYVFASQYHNGIKKLSKEPFHIKIDNFQPGSTLVILSCSTTWPGKANKDNS